MFRITIAGVVASAVAFNTTQLKSPLPLPVEQVYGANKKKAGSILHGAIRRSPDYLKVRAADNCSFPLDIVILQDATASFGDDYEEMRNVQLKLVTDSITNTHPGTRFGIVSFKDKPVFSLGDADDYCFYENLPLAPTNFTTLYDAYGNLTSYGGADPAENQLGAMVAAAQSKTLGWGSNPLSTKLILLVTDAWFHYDKDGLNNYNMQPFTGTIDFANPAVQCLSQYYPSPDQTRLAIKAIGAYAGFLIFDPEWANNRPYDSWKWFNEHIGQTSDFITTAKSDSSDFWINLAKIIASIENAECRPTTTPAPPAPTGDCPTPNPADCPAVDVRYRHRPEYLNIDAE